MSLRDEITKEVWATIIGDQDRDQAADAIIARVLAYATSDEAVERARRKLSFHPSVRAAILAALGENNAQ